MQLTLAYKTYEDDNDAIYQLPKDIDDDSSNDSEEIDEPPKKKNTS